MAITPRLDDVLKPGKPLPPDELMIAKGLEILGYSPHGQQLTNTVEKENISIAIMATPQPVTYLPETRKAYVGFNRNNPVSPSRFVLMLAGVLREAQQELMNVKRPPLHASKEEFVQVSLRKEEDKIWYMCTVAYELNALEMFMEYNFLDELRKMGHDESIELYLQKVKKGS